MGQSPHDSWLSLDLWPHSSSSLWSWYWFPVPVTPETIAHQNSKCRETKPKQSFYFLILVANVRVSRRKAWQLSPALKADLPGQEISLTDHFCITGTKGRSCHQAMHLLLSNKLGDMWHPPKEGCVGVKGEHSCSPHSTAQRPSGCPHSCLSTDHCKRDWAPLQQRVGTTFRIALKCFPKGIWETIMSESRCESELFLLYIF